MGTTLANGLYLPSEGEKNSYSGLRTNWRTLDNLIATVDGKAALNIANTWTAEQVLAGGAQIAGSLKPNTDAGASLGSATHKFADIYANSYHLGAAAFGDIVTHNAAEFQTALSNTQLSAVNSGIDSTKVAQIATNTADIATKANDADVVHLSGNETISGTKTFESNNTVLKNLSGASALYLSGVLTGATKGDVSRADLYTLVAKDNTNGNYAPSALAYLTMGQNTTGSVMSWTVDTIGSTDSTRHNNGLTLQNRVTDTDNSADFYPQRTNLVNLGTSSNLWNAVYANAYYLGTTNFTDKFVTTDTEQTISGVKTFSNTVIATGGAFSFKSALTVGTIPSAITYYGAISNKDVEGTTYLMQRGYIGTSGDNCYRTTVTAWVSKNSSAYYQMRVTSDNSVRAFEVAGTVVQPTANATTDLGTTSKKWATINGINPGALSMPNLASSVNVALSAGSNTYTPPSNGWLSIKASGDISVKSGNFGMKASDMLSVPVVSGKTYTVTISASTTAVLFACLGNV